MSDRSASYRLQGERQGREPATGRSLADLLELPDALRGLVRWAMRQGEVGVADAAWFLQVDEEAAREVLASLVDRGYLRATESGGQVRYQVYLAAKRGRELPANVWQQLDKKVKE